jgi:hypothetical protein
MNFTKTTLFENNNNIPDNSAVINDNAESGNAVTWSVDKLQTDIITYFNQLILNFDSLKYPKKRLDQFSSIHIIDNSLPGSAPRTPETAGYITYTVGTHTVKGIYFNVDDIENYYNRLYFFAANGQFLLKHNDPGVLGQEKFELGGSDYLVEYGEIVEVAKIDQTYWRIVNSNRYDKLVQNDLLSSDKKVWSIDKIKERQSTQAPSIDANTIYFDKSLMAIYGSPTNPIIGNININFNFGANPIIGAESLMIYQGANEPTYSFTPNGDFNFVGTNIFIPNAINFLHFKYLGNNQVIKSIYAKTIPNFIPLTTYKVNPIIDEYLGNVRRFANANGGTSGSIVRVANAHGVYAIQTGTTNNGRDRDGQGSDTLILFNPGDMQVWEGIGQIETIGDVNDNYTVYGGFNNSDDSLGNYSVCLEYNYAQNGGNWRIAHRNNNAATYFNTNIPGVPSSFQEFRIELDYRGANPAAKIYHAKTLIHTITAGLPVGQPSGFMWAIVKSAGINNRRVLLNRQGFMVI